MTSVRLFYATNRAHLGRNRWLPRGYGPRFSGDGIENLRFGRISFDVDPDVVAAHLRRQVDGEAGDGQALCAYFLDQVQRKHEIVAYRERLDPALSEVWQPSVRLGSQSMFVDLHELMCDPNDVLIFIHGFNVSWAEAVAAASALQETLNHSPAASGTRGVQVVLFSWPSDGLALPFVSYKSDRTEARGSGYALARGLLKLRDFLHAMRDGTGRRLVPCRQNIHLLCHSMGNYVLQNTVERIAEFTPGTTLPRIFEHIFLCAPDVDDDVLEPGAPMGSIHELARSVTVYHNRGDMAMHVSDLTKGHSERLGTSGCARPALVHNKVHQVDCSDVVDATLDEHGYYLWGLTNQDIRQSIDGLAHAAPARQRSASRELPNVWRLADRLSLAHKDAIPAP